MLYQENAAACEVNCKLSSISCEGFQLYHIPVINMGHYLFWTVKGITCQASILA